MGVTSVVPDTQPNESIDAAKKHKHQVKPVSLKECALAYCRADSEFDMNYFTEDKPHPRGIKMARAVLDTAGVAYIDDTEGGSPESEATGTTS